MDVGEDDTNVSPFYPPARLNLELSVPYSLRAGSHTKFGCLGMRTPGSRRVQEVSLFDPSEEALNDINGVRSGWSLAGGVAWRRERWKRRRRNRKCGGGGAAIVVCERERDTGGGRRATGCTVKWSAVTGRT
ncbi:hypothetical protein L1987_69120 [Smallanthus sonchifolius]|uniref:Uncharacterized protein n=1 Tax=Smallanthus sonchifolius TaxID=185202 RepID=A0ACB9B6B8_9ASTR|nr:hypothetical protein L1987_69120 [Smallanthus sonchifolius]